MSFRKQADGLASRKHLASIVAGQHVTIEYQKRDRYGRIVGKALVDGIDACLEQVKAGFAWHYKKYQHEQSLEDQRLYADAEIRARAGKLRLWRENNPLPRWEFRRLQRSQWVVRGSCLNPSPCHNEGIDVMAISAARRHKGLPLQVSKMPRCELAGRTPFLARIMHS